MTINQTIGLCISRPGGSVSLKFCSVKSRSRDNWRACLCQNEHCHIHTSGSVTDSVSARQINATSCHQKTSEEHRLFMLQCQPRILS